MFDIMPTAFASCVTSSKQSKKYLNRHDCYHPPAAAPVERKSVGGGRSIDISDALFRQLADEPSPYVDVELH
jgi:hypothetical protein